LESGFVDIIKDGSKVAKLGAGKAFGELALINDINRTATVKAVTLCSAWTLDRQTMRNVLANQETTSRSHKIAFLKSVQLFVKLDDSTLGQIADVMKLVDYEPNERIIKQGEVGDHFYLIQSGTVVVTQGSKELTRLSTGSYFGELALISNEPRKATVTSVTALQCYTIDKLTFTSVLGSLQEAETQSTGISILRKVKLLETLPEKHLITMSKYLQSIEYNDGDNIVQQGDEGDQFYMIASGAVSVFVNHAEVARLNTGSYFGEMSLMNDERRNATVTALGPVTCLALNRAQVRMGRGKNKVVFIFLFLNFISCSL
jgi:CRP-like cAMP-binding protein